MARRPRRAIENLAAIVVMFCVLVVLASRAEMEFDTAVRTNQKARGFCLRGCRGSS